ncbi:Lactamase_B domain-containing protein [Psidium guajava]|nr:Lactamase_B domain-containing protein [Psidium guajava]
MYSMLNQAKLFYLTQALSEFKQGNQAVTTCFNHVLALWNELEAAEEQLQGPDETLQQNRAIKEREERTQFLLNPQHRLFIPPVANPRHGACAVDWKDLPTGCPRGKPTAGCNQTCAILLFSKI